MGKMMKYNLEATDENIMESIKQNTYRRIEYVKGFIEAIDLIDSNMFISLDAKWGEGKTFYIRQIEMTLKYLYLKKIGSDVSGLENVFEKSSLNNISLQSICLPIYYNSWLYDYHTDPLLSLLFVIVKQCGKYISTTFDSKSIADKIFSICTSFSLSTLKGQVALDLQKVKDSFQGKDILQDIKTAEEIREIIKLILDEVINENAQKLVIFIDELDRCKPSYAIELLERIKHYFDDERIIFIASLNKEQLVHTISKYYGSSFDSTGYLNRFFDYNMYLPDIPNYCKEEIFETKEEQYFLKEIVRELSEYYRLTLRDSIIFQQKMEAGLKEYCIDYTAQGCMLSVFVPIIQVLDIVSQSEKRKFMQGDDTVLWELFNNISSLNKLACRFGKTQLKTSESFNEGFEEIKNLYEWIFGNKKDYIGRLDVSADLKNVCIKVCNGF